MTAEAAITSSRALILAINGRDAELAARLLAERNVAARICPDIPAFVATLGDEVSLALITEETLRHADMRRMSEWVATQPEWSDLPFIILTRHGGGPERNPAAVRLQNLLGNVTFLERPFHPTTFLSVIRTALRGRYRQYEARARIEALNEGERRLQTALQAGRLGPWELDLTTWTLFPSPVSKAVFGRGPDEPFAYADLLDAIHPDDRARMQEAVRRAVENRGDYAIEYRTIWPDGSLHWAEVRGRFARDERNGSERMVGVTSDVTVRKTSEESLRQLNETLEQRVVARTIELNRAHEAVLEEMHQRQRAEEQLRQSQKMELLGQLTGGVAHDFNNLLMAVMGNLNLLRKHVGDDPRMVRLAEGALQGARRGAMLTQRMLAFARRQDLTVETVDMAEMVRGMRSLIERSAGPQVEVRLALPDKPLPALVDANQIELALLNLVVNARDAMPEGGALRIGLDAERVAVASDDLPVGTYLRLVVEDSGLGMDGETLRRATEPFFSTKELGKGTGLGLSMVQGLAAQLNGTLRISSTKGRGTRIELWLPMADAAMPLPVAAPSPPVETGADAAAALDILLVDDDELVAMSTSDMLQDLGHRVEEANGGDRALEILRTGRRVDLMITDYAMPRMNGAQLAEAARQLRPDLPILVATGYADLPQNAGLDLPRLAKPYQIEDLAAGIARLVAGVPGEGRP